MTIEVSRLPPEAASGSAIRASERSLPRGRGLLTLVLIAAFLWSILQIEWGGDLIHAGGVAVLIDLLSGLVRPDLSASIVRKALGAAWVTLTFAVASISLALLFAIPAGIGASGVLIRHAGARRWTMLLGRAVLALMRSIHELVWALLFVTAIGLSPYAAILALAIPYAGILGRIYADLLNDVPTAPLRALRDAGGSELKVLFYGRLPLVLPDLIAYSFYRFECAMRSSAIMSFIGIAGIGYQIQLALDDLKYRQVSTYLLALVVLVVATDIWSSQVRRAMVR
ncbi:MAG: ABC transporter permease subunit [Chloroflexota bacterium]|nr:ABC transporter permease subunit [Chloroflexota bacterium]